MKTKVVSRYLWLVNSREFHYDLPESAIAKHPLAVRRHARLLVRDTEGALTHSTFEALPDWLDGVGGLWANDTKVLHARLLATKPTGGQLEVFLLAPAGLLHEEALAATAPVRWQAMIRNVKRWSQGVASVEGRACTLTIEHAGQGEDGVHEVRLSWVSDGTRTFGEVLEDLGRTPLPPYMRRADTLKDQEDYQTVFAMTPGSVAAPTAGLHYDDVLLSALEERGTPLNRLTLHVGAGTFKPLGEGSIASHAMHAERCLFDREILRTMANQRKRVATGTTTLRAMESLYWMTAWHRAHGEWPVVLPQWTPYEGEASNLESWSDLDALNHALEHAPWVDDSWGFETQLMIKPGYAIRMVDGLVTNFHQPGSTLLCLVAAATGMAAWKSMYAEALSEGYRFLSYGDGCLLWCKKA